MTPSYSSVVVDLTSVSAPVSDILSELSLTAYVLKPHLKGRVVLFPRVVSAAPQGIDYLAAHISHAVPETGVIVSEVDAEDVLRIRVFQAGQPVLGYCTEPGFSDGQELPPTYVDVELFASILKQPDESVYGELVALLNAGRFDEQNGFGTAAERHSDIAEILDLPVESVGFSYETFDQGILPEGITWADVTHVHPEPPVKGQLRQYALFSPGVNESPGQTAARFLSDVIAFDEDFETGETPSPGTPRSIREHVVRLFPAMESDPHNRWLTLNGGDQSTVEMDLGNGDEETPVEGVHIFAHSGDEPIAMLSRIIAGKPWRIWSFQSRRVLL